MKHLFKMDGTTGQYDLFVLDVEEEHGTGHNGPGCTRCGYQFCIHCPGAKENWESDCPKEW